MNLGRLVRPLTATLAIVAASLSSVSTQPIAAEDSAQ